MKKEFTFRDLYEAIDFGCKYHTIEVENTRCELEFCGRDRVHILVRENSRKDYFRELTIHFDIENNVVWLTPNKGYYGVQERMLKLDTPMTKDWHSMLFADESLGKPITRFFRLFIKYK